MQVNEMIRLLSDQPAISHVTRDTEDGCTVRHIKVSASDSVEGSIDHPWLPLPFPWDGSVRGVLVNAETLKLVTFIESDWSLIDCLDQARFERCVYRYAAIAQLAVAECHRRWRDSPLWIPQEMPIRGESPVINAAKMVGIYKALKEQRNRQYQQGAVI